MVKSQLVKAKRSSMPRYRSASRIRATGIAESAVDKNFNDTEIIVSDDCPTDAIEDLRTVPKLHFWPQSETE